MKQEIKDQIVKLVGCAIFAIEWEPDKRSRVGPYRAMHGQHPTEEVIGKWRKEKKKNCLGRAEEAVKFFFES